MDSHDRPPNGRKFGYKRRSWMGFTKTKDRPAVPVSLPGPSRRLTINAGQLDNWGEELCGEIDQRLQSMKKREREGTRDSMCDESRMPPPPLPPLPTQLPPPIHTAPSSIDPSKQEINVAEVPRPSRATKRDSKDSEKRQSWWKEFFQPRSDSVTGLDEKVPRNGKKRASWTESLFRRKCRKPTKRLSYMSQDQTPQGKISQDQSVLPIEVPIEAPIEVPIEVPSGFRQSPRLTAQHQDLAPLEGRQSWEAEASRPLSPSLARSPPLYSSPPPLPIKHPDRNRQPEATGGEPFFSSTRPTPHDQWLSLPEVESD